MKKNKNRLAKWLVLVMMICYPSLGMANINGYKITLVKERATLQSIFKTIIDQYPYVIIYDRGVVDDQILVSVNIQNADITETMNQVLSSTDLIYELHDRNVIVKKRKNDLRVVVSKQEPQKTITIKGKVTDDSNNPIPFAAIRVVGTTLGTVSDVNGEYNIELIKSENLALEFSTLGFVTQVIPVNGMQEINVILISDIQGLGEIVVTGYQHIDKRKLSSSVTTVNLDQLDKIQKTSLDKMLEGQVAGLTVMGNSSTPGVATKVRIRGASSIMGNREPIWVVDGVVLEEPVKISANELNSSDYLNFIGNAIQSINPSDIQRVDVLKDASATAIYGTKAANGVIVITTKSGNVGKPVINYSGQFTLTERPNYESYNLMNSKERVDVSREIYERGLTFSLSDVPILGYEKLIQDYNRKLITQDQFNDGVARLETGNTDWFDKLYRNALTQRHDISISGGTDDLTYYFSGGYNNEQSPFIKGFNNRFNLMSKFNYKVNRKLNLGFNLRGSINKKEYNHNEVNPFSYAYNTPRTLPIYDENGDRFLYSPKSIYGHVTRYNFLNEIDNSGREIGSQRLDVSFDYNYKILEELSINGIFSVGSTATTDESWMSENTLYMWQQRALPGHLKFIDYPDFIERTEAPIGGQLEKNTSDLKHYLGRIQVDYNKEIKNHSINVVAGFEASHSRVNGLNFIARGYLPFKGKRFAGIDNSKYVLYNAWYNNHPNSVVDNISRKVSYYTALTYSYKNKYILNGNIRQDGSNKFGQNENDRFNHVWSSSLRWNVTEEKFLEDFRWLSLSIKGSYGIQGNAVEDQTPNLIVATGNLDAISEEFLSTLISYPNPNLKWEKTKSYNIGIEYGLFHKLRGNVEYYSKKGVDMVIAKDVSRVTGSSSHVMNGGTIENKGIEMSLNYRILNQPDYGLSVNINGYRNINKVTSSVATEYSYRDYVEGRVVIEDKPIGAFYSYKFDGLDENGMPKFKDTEQLLGESKNDFFKRIFTYSGSVNPKITGGFSVSANYKKLSVSCLFNYSMGSKIRLPYLYKNSLQELPHSDENLSREFLNRWRNPGDENHTNIPTLSNNYGMIPVVETRYAESIWQMYNQSDLRVVKGDFLRFSSLTFGYELPNSFLEQLKLKAATVNLNFNNLFLLADKRLNGHDPSVATFGQQVTPPMFGMGASLNIKF